MRNEVSTSQKRVLSLLLARRADSPARGIQRETVWQEAEVGPSVTLGLRQAALIERHDDPEDGSRRLYLTPLGVRTAKALASEASASKAKKVKAKKAEASEAKAKKAEAKKAEE